MWAAGMLGSAGAAGAASGAAGAAGAAGASAPAAASMAAPAAAAAVPAGTGAATGLVSQIAPTMASPLAGAGSLSGGAAPALTSPAITGMNSSLMQAVEPALKATSEAASVAPSTGNGLGAAFKERMSGMLDQFRDPKQMLRDKLKEDPQRLNSQAPPLPEFQPPGGAATPAPSSNNWLEILRNLKSPQQGGY